jgi:hypothetical protein
MVKPLPVFGGKWNELDADQVADALGLSVDEVRSALPE